MNSNVDARSLKKFDPEDHPNNAFEAFCEFVEEFEYEYDAVAKEPPKELTEPQKKAWLQMNKRKLFLGRYASRNLQKDYEEVVTEEERGTILFKDVLKRLKTHFEAGRNKTLADFNFHKLRQKHGESIDAFVIRVKREAMSCDFKCQHDDCTVQDTMVRDQIIIGTHIEEIRKNALKKSMEPCRSDKEW